MPPGGKSNAMTATNAEYSLYHSLATQTFATTRNLHARHPFVVRRIRWLLVSGLAFWPFQLAYRGGGMWEREGAVLALYMQMNLAQGN